MLSLEMAIEKIRQLPPEQHHKVIEYIEFLEFQSSQQKQSTARANPWQSLFESLDQFSEDFMTTREQPPFDVREAF